ncbi:hypothetical protein [Thalassospira mesophila]|uniref:hypothetical protein n=1 Tax=Thalassospira mesophila TaxID=1293891 RepID=UPI00117FE377|nr:hypothetical protein [Thalassospira mesophila]
MAALLRYSSVSLRGSDPNRVAVSPAAIYVTYTLCGDVIIVFPVYKKVKVPAGFVCHSDGFGNVALRRVYHIDNGPKTPRPCAGQC